MPENNPGTFELFAIELGRALEPVAARLHDPHHALMFLTELGLKLPEASVSPDMLTALQQTHTAAHELPELTEALVTAIDGGNIGDIISKGVPVAQQVAALVNAFDTIADEMGNLGAVPGIDPADLNAFIAGLPKRLFEILVVQYFEGYHRIPYTILEFLGLIENTRVNVGSIDPSRPEFVRKELRFDRIGALLQSPDQLLGELYGWNQPTFDPNLLLQRVAAVLRALRVPVTQWVMPGTPPRQAIEVCAATIAPMAGTPPPGLEAILTLNLGDGVTLDLPFAAGWLAHLAVDGALSASAGIRVQPPADVSVIPPSGSAQGRLHAGLARVPVAPAQNIVLLGLAGGTGLTAERIGLNLIAGFRWQAPSGPASGDFGFEGEIQGGKLRIGMDGADGFLGEILSGVSVEADFNLGFGWTAGQGVYFTGSSVLEIQLPVHISLGPVELDALTLQIGIDGNRFPIGLSTNIKADLGPLVAVVEQIGAAVELSFPASGRGDIGPLDIDFKFKPPRGVGLSVNAGVIVGGGYLFIDPDRGQYAGALELTFSGFLALKAIGIITTKMPDGSDGFSLLLIITAEFGTGLQLGYGFTLLGVGGLLGLNRTMRLQELAEGVRSGAVESVMFPQNVIANAPKIISDLNKFFPPQEGKFLIGPMAKIGWGTPTLISISLGVIIEIPGNIAIVGVLKIAIPADEIAIIVIQVNFIGAIEFDKKRIWFFAALFESRVAFITLEGEMGLLMAFGDDANFVVSVGGFHPSFSPPPLPFPAPRRIAVNILNTPVARVRIEGYFAVTSNTVQFGARVEVFFGLGDVLNVQGHLAFDALFQFSPFYFIIEISASFSVKVFGVGLFSVSCRGSLDGPSPWHVKGHGSISLLFWDIDVDFEKTWGESQNTELPPVPVMPILTGEIDKADNWRALPPAANNLLVSLRKMTAEESALVLHPVGVLRVSQRALPLELKLDKVGTQKPSDVNRLAVAVAGGGLAKKADAFEQFAPAQFQNFQDSQKLSSPAFEPERSGLELSAAGADLRSSVMVKRIVRYEEIIIDNNFKRFQRRFRGFFGSLFEFFLGGNAASRCDLSQATRLRLQPFEEKIAVRGETYTVAFQSNNQAFAADAATFHSEASARDYMNSRVAADASLADTIHVIPSFERAA
ncbi:MAG TPA: DUF6603 domain-containing protein [Pyrinomonadaceae bacterium]